MPSFQPVMQWVTKLPEVGEPILKEREAVIPLAREAADFDRLASEKRGELIGHRWPLKAVSVAGSGRMPKSTRLKPRPTTKQERTK